MITLYVGSENTDFASLHWHATIIESAIRRPTLGKSPINHQSKELRISAGLQDPRQEFDSTAKQFSTWLEDDDVTVIVSALNPLMLTPLLGEGPENLLAMLILAFPEVRWLFGTIRGYGAGTEEQKKLLDDFRRRQGFANLFRPAIAPLFDGAGLRDWVRQRMREDKEVGDEVDYLPHRRQLAVGLDEETDYAQLHAYVAYRFGFLAVPLSTQAQAETVLGSASKWPAPTVVFEDVFLNLPDGGRGFSRLDSERHYVFPRLESDETMHRVLVTSGQRVGGDDEKWAANHAYIEDQKARGVCINTLHKPHAGMFRIWEDAGLTHALKWTDAGGRTHRGVGEGFLWPPRWKDREDESRNSRGGHSCPGILLVIAQCLIGRAENLFRAAHTVGDAVRGAVLATDALELLGGKTPTMAVAALRLKHEFEVLAVCQFSGVEYHFAENPRLLEIERDTESISRWFHPSQKESAKLNAEMSIFSRLVQVFRDHNHFDEEQLCMNRVRRLHNTLWMRERRPRYVLWPIVRYIEWLLGSFPRFVAVLTLWVLLFSWLYWVGAGHHKWEYGLQDSISSFFSIGGPIDQAAGVSNQPNQPYYAWVVSGAILLGFVHLGVFISHLYSIVSRK
jgi:hypothetical protein